jgi:D-arabinose 1-dehydrogenase-like Zn-dependent alcohol dehydrogenase
MTSIPKVNYAWPLFGAGLENLGMNGEPELRRVKAPSDDEILIRHDAVSLCYTDLKEINFGDTHPRLVGRNLKEHPIVPGHETSMTVLAVGKNRQSEYSVGERYVIQPDVWYQGKSVPYSFGIDGAYRQYAIIGKEVLDGDAGSYLLPVPEGMCYAGAALTEPWACVEASYRMSYRNEPAAGGILWIYAPSTPRSGYFAGNLLSSDNAPKKVFCSGIPAELKAEINEICLKLSIEMEEKPADELLKADIVFDDILMLDPVAADVDSAADRLNKGGILTIFCEDKIEPIPMDLGRIHYDHIVIVGSTGVSLEDGYRIKEIQPNLKKDGITMILGAGGPMGRMHVQRAIESSERPRLIVAVNTSKNKLEDLMENYSPLAAAKGVELLGISPISDPAYYNAVIDRVLKAGGFDDIEVMISHLPTITESFNLLAENGTMNVFAGVKKGTKASFDAYRIYGPMRTRLVGYSGSGIEDQISIIDRYKAGELETRRSVIAIGGFRQIPEGVQAMAESRFPGKIVIYPGVEDFPLTAISELADKLPEVFAALEDGRVWTAKAENEFLTAMEKKKEQERI